MTTASDFSPSIKVGQTDRQSFLGHADLPKPSAMTGRQLRAGKRGAIPDHLAPILDRLGVR
jgi:hypothetical protein